MQLLLQQAVALQHGHHDLLPHPVVTIILLGLLPANKTIFVNVLWQHSTHPSPLILLSQLSWCAGDRLLMPTRGGHMVTTHCVQGTVASTWTWQHNRGPAPAAGRRGQQHRVRRLPAARGSRCHCPRCPPPPPPRPRPPRVWGRGRAATRSCGYSPGSRSSRTAVCLCSPGQPCDILVM